MQLEATANFRNTASPTPPIPRQPGLLRGQAVTRSGLQLDATANFRNTAPPTPPIPRQPGLVTLPAWLRCRLGYAAGLGYAVGFGYAAGLSS
ncbi:hypothetical protein OHJ21_23105 [Virgibacillus sp. LDC1]|nr:hypothetical protein [Virgibacillus sp. LDC1]